MTVVVHVAVAVILSASGEVCISLRHENAHQGGLWEFPGGKVESNEDVTCALAREVKEELGIDVIQSRPLITIEHSYVDKKVCLHVHKVTRFKGIAIGAEGQQVKWVNLSQLSEYAFPAANFAIIQALQLPDRYLITGNFFDLNDFDNKLTNALNKNIKLVQLRLKDGCVKDASQAQKIVEHASNLCQQKNVKLMLNLSEHNLSNVNLSDISFSGFHVDSRTLRTLSSLRAISSRASLSVDKEILLSASCHNMQELMRAEQLKADFVVLSPVQKTASHPEVLPLGWKKFSEMVEKVSVPVYALGGVSESDMPISWSHGAQGVAAISAYWR